MRIGFFHGVEGELARWQRIRELLSDCDRLISLGNFFGEAQAPGNGALWEAWWEEEGRLLLLMGRRERSLARCLGAAHPWRQALSGLQEGTVERGVAFLGTELIRQQRGSARSGQPRLVAPLTVAAGEGGARIWRDVGGLCRVETVEGGGSWTLGGVKHRLDLGPAARAFRCGIFEPGAGRLELRGEAEPVRSRPATERQRLPGRQGGKALRRRRAKVAVGQVMLAV